MSLKRKAASGAKWTTASKGVSTGLQLIQLGVLARLLDQEDFGLMAMVMVVIGFAEAYIDMGIGKAIIHRQDTTSEQLSSLYWLNLGAGAIVFGLVILAIPLIVDFYNEPRLTDLLFWASLMFLITPFGQQFHILMQKELKFKLLAIITIASALAGVTVAIVTALQGQGVYSLIWGQLTNAATRTVAFVAIGYREWPPGFHFRWDDLRGYLGFGAYQMGEKTLNYFAKNIDYLLIGRYLGSEILGAYTIAFQLVIVPIQKINPILTKVAFPIFSKRQHQHTTLSTGYLEMSKVLAMTVYPLLIGLAATAPVAIPVFLGEGWELSIILTQILVLVGLARTLGNPSGTLYLAKGRADIGFKFNLVTAVINAVVFWICVQYGVLVIASAFAMLNILYLLAHTYIIHRLIDLSLKAYWQKINMQIYLSALMGGIVYGLYYLVSSSTISAEWALGILVIVGGGIYILLTLSLEKQFVSEMKNILISKKKNGVTV